MDFPVTRATIAELPRWVGTMAALLPPPVRKPLASVGFRWEHPVKSAEVVQVAKSVRMASGLRAAMALADIGHTTEAGTILRTVADFAAEITFLGEGLLEGRLTAEQEKFVEQHFSDLPLTPDELADREREHYISRKKIAKAHDRLLTKAGADSDLHAKLSAFLNKGYDSFVHGAYASAMELFTGESMTFMLTGSHSERQRCATKTAVAGRLVESLHALRFMAITRQLNELQAELRRAADSVDTAGEQSGVPCRGVR